MKRLFSLIFLLCAFSLLLNPLVSPEARGQTKTQNLSVSATVQPGTSDYQFSLVAPNGETTISQGKIYAYEITYGTLQSAKFDSTSTITLTWSDDLAPNHADLLDYVFGSAPEGYGGAKPIVDIINRTITWTITMPPGVTDQKLDFHLYSNGAYTGTGPSNITIVGTMKNQFVTMPDQLLRQSYHYIIPPPGPTATPVPQPTAVITPTPAPILPGELTNVSFTNVTDSQTTIVLTTTTPTRAVINYGTSPDNLDQSATTGNYSYKPKLTLRGLKPNTAYYMQFTIYTEDGKYRTSEIFTFRTAILSQAPFLDDNIIDVSANGEIFISELQNQADTNPPLLLFPTNSDYEIAYKLTRPFPLKSVNIIVRDNVLAATITSFLHELGEFQLPFGQKSPFLYVASLQNLEAGSYEVFVRITDKNGNILEKKLIDLKVIPHLAVYDTDKKTPLFNARVYLWYYDKTTKSYLPLDPLLFSNALNPTYTNTDGETSISLPPGNYRVQASAPFYDYKTQDFTLGAGKEQIFPILYLKHDPRNIVGAVTYIGDFGIDMFSKAVTTVRTLASSIRLFNILTVTVTASFIVLTYLFFLFRSHLHIKFVPIFFLFNLATILNKHKDKYLFGKVINEKREPISRVEVIVEDANTKNVLKKILTNKTGSFYFENTFRESINVLFLKEGFAPTTLTFSKADQAPARGLRVEMAFGKPHIHTPFSVFVSGAEKVLGMLFEVSLVISILFEIFFFLIYGFSQTAPFLILSLINIILWLLFLRENSSHDFEK